MSWAPAINARERLNARDELWSQWYKAKKKENKTKNNWQRVCKRKNTRRGWITKVKKKSKKKKKNKYRGNFNDILYVKFSFIVNNNQLSNMKKKKITLGVLSYCSLGLHPLGPPRACDIHKTLANVQQMEKKKAIVYLQ